MAGSALAPLFPDRLLFRPVKKLQAKIRQGERGSGQANFEILPLGQALGLFVYAVFISLGQDPANDPILAVAFAWLGFVSHQAIGLAKRLGLDGEGCLDSFSITQCHLHRCLKGGALSWNGVADGARQILPIGQ